MQPQPDPEEQKTETKKKKKGSQDGSDEENEEGEEEAEEEAGEEEGDEKKDKKPTIQPPVAPLLVGRPEPSERDMMIELRSKSPATTSSTYLAVSCFHEKQVIIAKLDIKTRSRQIKQTFKIKNSPTYLYQIDEDNMLVGTIEGTFEVWNIKAAQEEPQITLVINAHPQTQQGISNIIKLNDPSPMIVGGDKLPEDTDILVSTAADQENILIWRLTRGEKIALNSYININTSFTDGIKYIVQSSPTQLVAVNHEKTLMFYDFVDKNQSAEEKDKEKDLKEFGDLVEEAFREADEDGNNWLDIDECRPMCEALINTFGDLVNSEQKAGLLDKMFSWLDSDNSGRVTFHEFKVAVMRAYINRQLPDEIVGDQ